MDKIDSLIEKAVEYFIDCDVSLDYFKGAEDQPSDPNKKILRITLQDDVKINKNTFPDVRKIEYFRNNIAPDIIQGFYAEGIYLYIQIINKAQPINYYFTDPGIFQKELIKGLRRITKSELNHYPLPEEVFQKQFINDFLSELPFEKLKALVNLKTEKKINGDLELTCEISI